MKRTNEKRSTHHLQISVELGKLLLTQMARRVFNESLFYYYYYSIKELMIAL